MEFKHKSVLLEETIEGLRVKPDGIYVDGTLGGAGHAGEVCRRLSAKGRFIGIDQDQDAIIAAGERLAVYGERVTVIRCNYCYMVDELKKLGIRQVDGILLDLGVSSYQLIMESAVFPTGQTRLLTCVWISGRPGRRQISLTVMKKKNCTGSSGITVKINSRKI